MAHIRKVTHRSGRTAWQATIATRQGKRRAKNFPLKADAQTWVRQNDGASASGSATMTFLELARAHGRAFEALVKAGAKSQRTADGYDSHIRIHLQPDVELSGKRLSETDTPALGQFLARVLDRTGSVETVRRVKKSLVRWCGYGASNGWLAGNPAKECDVAAKTKRRAASKIQIPEKAALSKLLDAAAEGAHPERDSAIVNLLMFAGLRISELLGLPDDAVAVSRTAGTLSIQERLCSRYVTLGDVKSDDGLRDVPIGPRATAAIKAWRLARGPSAAFSVQGVRHVGRLFPAPPSLRYGALWAYNDFRRLCWWPLMLRAGLGSLERDAKGIRRPVVDFSPHTLRHVYASVQIESGTKPKRLQALMGHATLAMTMDLYGHLWTDPAGDIALAAAAERMIPRNG